MSSYFPLDEKEEEKEKENILVKDKDIDDLKRKKSQEIINTVNSQSSSLAPALPGNGNFDISNTSISFASPISPSLSPTSVLRQSSAPMPLSPADHPPNPEENASWLSFFTCWWLNSLIALGAKRPLEDRDLYRVRVDMQATGASERFHKLWIEENLMALKENRPRSLVKVLLSIYGRQYFLVFLAKLFSDLLTLAQPMLLQRLLIYIESPSSSVDNYYGYLLSFLLFLAPTLSSLLGNLYFRITMGIGLQVRTCLVTAIYRKSLCLSNKSRLERSTGQIVNLMSTDSSKIDAAIGWAQNIVACIIQICVATALLLVILGPIALAGIAVVVFLIPIQGKIVRVLQRIRAKAVTFTDARVKLTNEILQGVKVIKLYAWEESFLNKLDSIRQSEMALVRKAAYIRAFNVTLAQFGPILMSLIAFVALAAIGGDLTPQAVWSSFILYGILRFPLFQVPLIGGMLADSFVSYKRINEFLVLEELPLQLKAGNSSSEWAIEMKKASFVWDAVEEKKEEKEGKKKKKSKKVKSKDETEHLIIEVDSDVDFLENAANSARKSKWGKVSWPFHNTKKHWSNDKVESLLQEEHKEARADIRLNSLSSGGRISSHSSSPSASGSLSLLPPPPFLRDISLQIRHGSLTAIVGSVGAGKSSLLSGLLGEMRRTSGDVTINGSIAYCPQTAWIQNTTLRENILFGLPYDYARYYRVIEVCALQADLAILPAGDLTEIGEKGITLSGGQRQRVNLARAVYHSSDILLLDDIFSALDAHVGAVIFKECILNELNGKTRLLVTHQLQYVHMCHHILYLKNGKIEEQGTFPDLMANRGEFAQLLESYGGHNETEPKEEKRKGKEKGTGKEKSDSNDESAGPDDKSSKKKKQSGVLMQVEERSTGSVSLSVYRYYMSAMGGWLAVIILILMVITNTGSKLATDYFLALWSDDVLDKPVHFYMLVYSLLGASQCIFVLILTIYMARHAMNAAIKLHNVSFRSVLRSPLSFFDTTPIGRILHRFSKDQDAIDNTLSDSLRALFVMGGGIIGTLLMMAVVTPLLIIPLVPCLILYYRTQARFRRTSREVKRMDSLSRSPLFAHFSETITGLQTIRAYDRQSHFIKGNEERMDGNNIPYFLSIVCARWIGTRLELMGSIILGCCAIVIVTSHGALNVGLAGLTLSYAMTLTVSFTFMIRQSIETEMAMNSVERSKFYAEDIPQERPAIEPKDAALGLLVNSYSNSNDQLIEDRRINNWPSRGQIIFQNVSMRYRPNLPLILKEVSLEILPGSRVGVVGRTGAGKSSLLTALFRLVEIESSGRILIDGVNIAEIGLKTLRENISIIPQDAVLYSGTIRSNLDPFSRYSDSELWRVVEQAQLMGLVQGIEKQFDSPVSEGGENLSQGQRCQLCLARAMLRRSRIVVLDEATASIDMETDALIQDSIRKYFNQATIVTIAHRLLTIIDYDAVIVLDQGKIVEYDTPASLMRREGSEFNRLCAETGDQNFALLRNLANEAEKKNQNRTNWK